MNICKEKFVCPDRRLQTSAYHCGLCGCQAPCCKPGGIRQRCAFPRKKICTMQSSGFKMCFKPAYLASDAITCFLATCIHSRWCHKRISEVTCCFSFRANIRLTISHNEPHIYPSNSQHIQLLIKFRSHHHCHSTQK